MNELSDRKKRLNEKLNIAQQKIVRTDYIKKLPIDLNNQIRDMSFITSPEKEMVLKKLSNYSKLFNLNKQDNVKLTLDGYFYKEYSWTNQVIQGVSKLDRRHDTEEAYYLPFSENSPIYIVKFGWAKENFSRLWDISSNYDVCIVSLDFAAAIITSHYGGYLCDDPNPNEVVYEIESWGY